MHNPLLTIPDPYAGYQDNIDKLGKHNSDSIVDEQLCYEVFYLSEAGKKLMERWEERILMKSKINPFSPDAMQVSYYLEIIKGFIIGIKMSAENHKMRILAGNTEKQGG